MQYLIWGIIGVVAVAAFAFMLFNFRKQRDFEGTGRTPPEDYD